MKNILKIKFLLVILLVATSCDQFKQEGNTLEAKLEGLQLATREDLVRLGELELNSSNIPVYNTKGKRYSDHELLEILETNRYRIDYYLDEDERLGAVVVEPLAAKKAGSK